jgi:8-oxo-dGTP diphosphatase
MHSPHFPDSFHRVSVKGLCVQDGKILLVKEPLPLSGQWELPGGGLDFGENTHECLKREIEEEMKVPVISVSEQPVYVWTCRFEDRRDMEWYYSLVLGYRIMLAHTNFTPTEECEDVKFFTRDELETLDLFRQSLPLRAVFNPTDF